ncbi:MAG: DnaD domain protein [Firmicutes bacterium]|nr:DnaD domain protein [Bacillota bacterium]
MAFVSFSAQSVLGNTTTVSNVFINEYLPTLPDNCVKVYLYGLHLCSSGDRYDNEIEHFARTMSLSREDIISIFTYLSDLGLVQILSLNPIQIKYLPVISGGHRLKKIKKGKYDDFNAQLQAIFNTDTISNTNRMISSNDFGEYHSMMEYLHIEPQALVMIAKYCVDLKKDKNVSTNYILTVAKNWAYAEIKTVESVEKKIMDDGVDSKNIQKILVAMGSKKTPEPADFEMYHKWKNDMGFGLDVIIHVAKGTKGGMSALDTRILKYFELKLFEIAEIKDFEDNKQNLRKLARAINKEIGEFYADVDSVIENYIRNWQMMGFDDNTLMAVAKYCFKSNVKTLDGMNRVIERFYKLGVTNVSAIENFVGNKVTQDKVVKDVLEKLGSSREVNSFDRNFYNTWKSDWKMPDELIEYAITMAKDKASPMAYMNKILSSYHDKGIQTAADAKKTGTAPLKEKNFIRHSFSDEKNLSRIFADLNDTDI